MEYVKALGYNIAHTLLKTNRQKHLRPAIIMSSVRDLAYKDKQFLDAMRKNHSQSDFDAGMNEAFSDYFGKTKLGAKSKDAKLEMVGQIVHPKKAF